MLSHQIIEALQSALNVRDFAGFTQTLDALDIPTDPQVKYWRAVALAAQAQFAEAIALLNEVIVVAPDISAPRYELGKCLLAIKSYAAAYAMLESVLKMQPGHVPALINFGFAATHINKPAQAEGAFRRAREIQPARPEAAAGLASLYERAGFVSQAKQVLSDFVLEHAADSNLLQQWTRLVLQHEPREQAAATLDRYLQMHPQQPVVMHARAALQGQAPARASQAYVQSVFDDFAHSYDSTMVEALGYRSHQKIANVIRALVPIGSEILDVGCGTGLVATELAADYVLDGVDLSRHMLELAKPRGYRALHCQDIESFLTNAQNQSYAAATLADVWMYFGELAPSALLLNAALRPRGLLVANFEQLEGQGTADEQRLGYRLQANGRYQHSADYIQTALRTAGFSITAIEPMSSRHEGGKAVNFWLVSAHKSDSVSPMEVPR